jgi:arsenite-transporting ATPase
MNPAFEESAMFERMVDLMFADQYDTYVFDTAPAANARRLLGMSKVYTLWVEKMLASRAEATSLRKTLSFSKKEEKDPLLDYLLGFRKRIDKVHALLTDARLTAFFFVTLPEALPIAVIKRFIGWFKDFGIPVGGVIVNGLIDRRLVTDKTHEFVTNRIASQEKYMQDIYASFPDVRAIMPRLDHEIQGVERLRETFDHLFT